MICEKCSHTRSCKKVIGLYENKCDYFNISKKYLKTIINCEIGDILYCLNTCTPYTSNIFEAKVIEKDIVSNSINVELAFSGNIITVGGTNKDAAKIFHTNKDLLIDEIKNNKKIKRSIYIGFNNDYTIKE